MKPGLHQLLRGKEKTLPKENHGNDFKIRKSKYSKWGPLLCQRAQT